MSVCDASDMNARNLASPSVTRPFSSNWDTSLMDEWFAENLARMKLDDDELENAFENGDEISLGPFQEMIGEAVPFLRDGPCDDGLEHFVFCSDKRQYGDYASIGGLWFELNFKVSHDVAVSNYLLIIGICVETRRLTIEIKEAYNKSSVDSKGAHKYTDVLEKALQYCATAFLKLHKEQESHGESTELVLLSKAATLSWIQANVDCMKTLHWHLEETESVKQIFFSPSEADSDRAFMDAMPDNASGQFEYLVPSAVTDMLLQKKQPNFKCEESVSRFAFEGELAKLFPSTTNILLGYRDTPNQSWAFSMAIVYKKSLAST